MLYSNVFGNRVSAPGTASECEGGSKTEIVKVADTAVRRRSVYKNTAGLHSGGKLVNLCLFSYSIEVNRRGVSVSAVSDKMFSLVKSVANILCLVHSKNRRKLFMRKFFADVNRLNFTDKNFC